jgi:transposase-like protein
MAEQFPEHWEYWTPSAEWAEAFAEECPTLFDPQAEVRKWNPHGGTSAGFRMGRGRPDAFWPRLAPERVRVERERTWDDRSRACRGCPRVFTPDRPGRRYCSVRCGALSRLSRRTLPEFATCAACGALFRPDRGSRTRCSRRCSGQLGTDPAVLERVVEMRAAGLPNRDIAERVGVRVQTVGKYVRACPSGAVARRTGKQRPAPDVLARFRAAWDAGAEYADLMREFGIARGTVQNWREWSGGARRGRGGARYHKARAGAVA